MQVADNMTQDRKTRISAEVVGLAAVVLSLVLVALELRQNTIALEGQAVLDLNQSVSVMLDLNVDHPEIGEVNLRLWNEPNAVQDLSGEEFVALVVFANKVMSAMEAAWFMNDLGLIDDEQLSTYKHGFCEAMNSKTHKVRIDNNRKGYRKQFLDEFVAYCENRPEGISW